MNSSSNSRNIYSYTHQQQFTHSNSLNINTQEVHLTGHAQSPTNVIKKPQTKIRIEEIKNMKNYDSSSSEEIISKLTQLVKEYQEELEKKENDISQMKALLISFESTIGYL